MAADATRDASGSLQITAADGTDESGVVWSITREELLPIVIAGITAAVLALLCSVCLCMVLESGRKRPFGRLDKPDVRSPSWRRRNGAPEPTPRDLSAADLQIALRVLIDLRDLNRSETETDLEVAKLTYFGSDVVQLLKRMGSSGSLVSTASSAPSAAGMEAGVGTSELPSRSQQPGLAALLPVQAMDTFTRARTFTRAHTFLDLSSARVERPRPANLPSLTGPHHKSAPDLPSLALGHVDRTD